MMPFSDEDLLDPVKSIIDNKIANMVRKDGGDIELITVKNSTVFVQLKGSCVGCSSSSTTLKYVVEKELKDAIHPEIKIINVPIGMENRIEELI
jgi:Fe-S cluster biogenesis protein NfuA